MKSPIDSLPLIGTFVAVVDAGSFAGAARGLGLTRSAVSKQIARLEAMHGVRLLHRTTRRLALTDAGSAFFARCAPLVDGARSAIEELGAHGQEPMGLLRVSAPIGHGEVLVAPALAELLAAHPKLRAELVLEDEVVDLVGEGYDVAIRAGKLADSSLTSRKLGRLSLCLLASREYADANVLPTDPEDLRDHAWVSFSVLGSRQRLVLSRDGERRSVTLEGRLSTNNGAALLSALERGVGIGMLPRFYVQQRLSAGALVEVLPEWSLPEAGVWALWPTREHVPAKVRRFLEILASRS